MGDQSMKETPEEKTSNGYNMKRATRLVMIDIIIKNVEDHDINSMEEFEIKCRVHTKICSS